MKEIDIIIVNETWLYKEETDLFTLPNYDSIFNCRERSKSKPKSRGEGTAIFVNNKLKHQTLLCKDKLNQIVIQLEINKEKFKIATMYRPPNTKVSDFYDELEQIMHKFDNIINAGDINIDLLDINDTNASTIKEYQNLITSYGHKILNTIDIDHATRVTNTSKTIVDHVFTDMNIYRSEKD